MATTDIPALVSRLGLVLGITGMVTMGTDIMATATTGTVLMLTAAVTPLLMAAVGMAGTTEASKDWLFVKMHYDMVVVHFCLATGPASVR
jgi:hypothetical protein